MVLRFQDKDEEVDRAAKRERRSIVVFVGIGALVMGLWSWLSGDSLHSYGEFLAFAAVCLWALWMVSPIYYEFQIRTKEIDGKVSAIEAESRAAKEERADLLEKLTAIEEKLDAIWRERG